MCPDMLGVPTLSNIRFTKQDLRAQADPCLRGTIPFPAFQGSEHLSLEKFFWEDDVTRGKKKIPYTIKSIFDAFGICGVTSSAVNVEGWYSTGVGGSISSKVSGKERRISLRRYCNRNDVGLDFKFRPPPPYSLKLSTV